MNKLYFIGTTHLSGKSTLKVCRQIREKKINLIFSEGSYGRITLKNAFREPLLYIIIKIYFWSLTKIGREASSIKKLAIERNIPIINIDLPTNEPIGYYHRWYNHPLTVLMMGFLFLLVQIYSLPLFLELVLILLISGIISLGYFVIRTKKFREESFTSKIQHYLGKTKKKRVLIICGKYHSNCIKTNFRVTEL